MEILSAALIGYITQLPLLLAWLIGLIIALINRKRHPRVSRLTSIAMIGFIVTSFISRYLTIALPLQMQERGLEAIQVGVRLAVIGFAESIISAILWGLLFVALFGSRSTSATVEQSSK